MKTLEIDVALKKLLGGPEIEDSGKAMLTECLKADWQKRLGRPPKRWHEF